MKNIHWLSLLFVSICIFACQNQEGSNSTSTNNEGEEVNTTLVLDSINNYVASVRNERDNLQKRGPLTVTRGDSTLEVTVYVEQGTPKLIYAQGANMDYQAYYYLKDRNLIFLEELGQEDKFYARMFYYSNDQLIEALEKVSSTREKLPDTRFKSVMKRRYPEQFGFRPIEAYKSAMSLLMGR